jgi:lysozyme
MQQMICINFMSKLKDMLKRHEGCKLLPYTCPAGFLTIGYGRNIEKVGISVEEANHLLENDMDRCLAFLSKYPWFENLDQIRKDIMISMVFNMGETKFLQFKKMIIALYGKDYELAAKEMENSLWYNQVKNRARELVEMMRTGKYLE